VTLSQKQWEYHTKREKQKQCHTSQVKHPDLSTTRIRPRSNYQVPGSGTQPNSLPVTPLIIILRVS